MFNSVVLDVVIGLVFIYLLYSLLATILSEVVATLLSLRARNLKETIDRMLNDDKHNTYMDRLWDSLKLMNSPKNPVVDAFYDYPEIKYQGSSGVFKLPSNFKASSFSKTILELLAGKRPVTSETINSILKSGNVPVFPVILKLDKQTPENVSSYQKLASCPQCIFKIISEFEWKKVSEETKDELKELLKESQGDPEKFEKFLTNWISAANPNIQDSHTKEFIKSLWEWSNHDLNKLQTVLNGFIEPEGSIPIGYETSKYIQSLWSEAQGDLEKFKLLLEGWFDKTMVQTLEWYKRKIRVVTFIIGLCIAWFFNADTFTIVKNLSVDKDARDKLVSMATAYVQNNKIAVDTTKITNASELKEFKDKLDSLLTIKEQLVNDINNANGIIGIGCWPTDTVKVKQDKKTNQLIYTPLVDTRSLPRYIYTTDSLKQKAIYTFQQGNKSLKFETKKIADGKVVFSYGAKWRYFFRLFYFHFFGFLVTAIAISLGAPFWFDLLNKLMQLRTSKKEETDTVNNPSSNQTVSPINRVG